jgi:acetyl-CoA C-acetyltransferase
VTDAVAILAAARTPIGRFGGVLKDVPAIDLGAVAARAAIKHSGLDDSQLHRLVAGQNIQVTPRGNPARQVLLKTGLPITSSDYTVNMNCASGLRAMTCLAGDLLVGDVEFGVAVGMENMSQTPYLVEKLRWGARLGNVQAVDFLADYILGDAGPMAEKVALTYGISRERQDAFAAESQRRASAAIASGLFEADIVAVEVNGGVAVDEHPRPGITAEDLGQLRPAFSLQGTVTAGNSSGVNDGAAAVVLSTQSAATRHGLTPRALVRGWVSAGVDPTMFGIGPVPAVRQLLQRAGVSLDEIGVIELNEAFASSTLAVIDDLGLPIDRVNVNGGAIALGHPVGATGLVLVTKLISELERRRERYGLVTMCVGNGQGMAVLLESVV